MKDQKVTLEEALAQVKVFAEHARRELAERRKAQDAAKMLEWLKERNEKRNLKNC